jgi:hypothetical protein
MDFVVFFVAKCPICRSVQPQDGYTVSDLARLLKGDFPIEAYCESCDEHWDVGIQQRAALREVIAFTSEGAELLKQSCAPATQTRH